MPARPTRPLAALAVAVLLVSHACGVFFSPRAFGATVANMYEATVPLTERSERGQALAFQDAMRQVLVRVTGRRDAGGDPALAPIVNDARRYVQQFRVVGNQFVAGFDGARVERAVTDAGRPLWGHERPATLVLLVSGDGAGRTLLGPGSPGELAQAVVRGGQLRGVPLVWPDAARPVNLADVTSGSPERLAGAASKYGAEAVLAGVASGTGANAQVRWTLVQGSESTQWRGSGEEGAQGAADWFARVFTAEPGAVAGALVAITVSGVADLRAYAAVTEYLQSLTLVSALQVDEVAGDNVVYRARVQGGTERLARAIGLGGRLEPLSNGLAAETGALQYRYRP